MSKDLCIAIEVTEADLAKTLNKHFEGLPGIQTTQWFGSIGEKGPAAVKTIPQIIILDDRPGQTGPIFQRLRTLQGWYPGVFIFVVSSESSPQHIVEVMKAGAAEYFLAPVNAQSLLNAVEEVRAKLANSGRVTQGAVYSFISSKGGLGSTVISVNSAVALARNKGQTVALSDMSFQSGDASVLLDISSATGILNLCQNFHRLDAALLKGVMTRHSTGIDFLPAPVNPESSEDIAPTHVARILEIGKKLYDFLLVDCTSMFVGECTVEAFKASDKVIVVTDLSVTAVRNAARLCQLIHKTGVGPDRVEIVINRYIKEATLSIEEVEKTLGRQVYWLFPNNFDAVVSSINRGIPLVRGNPVDPFSKNVMSFVEKLQNPEVHRDFRGLRGVFGRAL